MLLVILKTLTSVPTCFPQTIVRLGLHGNNITAVNADSFKCYPLVYSLELSSNRISDLPDHAFSTLPALDTLNLAWNQIIRLSNYVFARNNNLTLLILNYNKLTRLNKKTFQPLVNLRTLFLHGNKLKHIQLSFLSNLIDLSLNQLSTLNSDVFSNARNITVWLNENPWDCDCKLKTLIDTLNTKEIYIPFDPVCAVPVQQKGVLWSKFLLNINNYVIVINVFFINENKRNIIKLFVFIYTV